MQSGGLECPSLSAGTETASQGKSRYKMGQRLLCREPPALAPGSAAGTERILLCCCIQHGHQLLIGRHPLQAQRGGCLASQLFQQVARLPHHSGGERNQLGAGAAGVPRCHRGGVARLRRGPLPLLDVQLKCGQGGGRAGCECGPVLEYECLQRWAYGELGSDIWDAHRR
jgi:hypothetical protein